MSYLFIDSSRSPDGRWARQVRDAVWGARSGASRNLRCDVHRALRRRAFQLRSSRTRAVTASRRHARQLALRGRIA